MFAGACGFTILGFTLVYYAIDESFIDLSGFDELGAAHVVLGLMLVAVSIGQVLGGFIIDRLFDVNRLNTPWWDKVRTTPQHQMLIAHRYTGGLEGCQLLEDGLM